MQYSLSFAPTCNVSLLFVYRIVLDPAYILSASLALSLGARLCIDEESKSLLGHLRECTITYWSVFPHLGLFFPTLVGLRHMHAVMHAAVFHLHQQCAVRELLRFPNPGYRVSSSALAFSVASALQVNVVIERHRPSYKTIITAEVRLRASIRPSLPGFAMSSFMLFGNFAVAGASRVSSSQKVDDKVVTTFYYLYDTTISVRDGPPIQASLRVYSPPNDVPFPEQSIVFAYTKAHAPTNDTFLLDAISVFAYPGNPDDDGYQDGILDFPATFAVFTGLVRTQGEPMPSDPTSRSFLVDVSEHVRDSERISALE